MLLLTNANIYTGFKNSPNVTGLLIHEDRILATGRDDELKDIAPVGTPEHNLNGKTVLPGITDSHVHLKHFALSLQSVNCETATMQECLDRLAEKVAETAPGEWITGWGWNQNVWDEGFGTAEILDTIAPNNPVFLTAKSGHAAWANTMALQIAGVDEDTPDPDGGVIQRDTHGQPTGIFFETAEGLIYEHIPPTSEAKLKDSILAAQSILWELGLTGVHDFDTTDLFSVLQQLERENKLKLRVVKSIPHDKLDHAIAMGLRSGFGSAYLRTGSLKVFVDGALGPQTAAMLEPFENSDDRGILLMEVEEIFALGIKASSHGISLAIHAIGDLANRSVLDAYALLRKYEKDKQLPPLRHRIEHVQLLHPADISRLAELGITASMQPIHATSDIFIADQFWGERSRGAYAFQSLSDHNTVLTFGSDTPVESPNPFLGIHAAVTRRRPDGTPGEDGWYPEQRLPLADALHAYTYAPALTAGTDHFSGKLISGNVADLIVLGKDPFDMHPQELYNMSPERTMVGGCWVWQK